jgi:hypothetical protein
MMSNHARSKESSEESEVEGGVGDHRRTAAVVTVVLRLDTTIVLDLVFVSFSHWAEVSSLIVDDGLVDGEGLATPAVPAAPARERLQPDFNDRYAGTFIRTFPYKCF